MTSVITTHVKHTRLPNGLDHLLLLDNSRLAADGLVGFLDQYLATIDSDSQERLLLLVELTRGGMPPLAYLQRSYQDVLKKHAPKQLRARIAYVYVSGFVMPIVSSIFRLIRQANQVERQFFPLEQRAQAEAWLLQGQTIKK